MKDIKESDVYIAINSGMTNFKIIAKDNLAKKWHKMDRKQRYAAGRSLVYLNGVAQNPRQYFSRAATQNDWALRAEEFAADKKIYPTYQAFYIVQSPMNIVCNKAENAFAGNSELYRFFYAYCSAIQNWEYDRTSWRPEMRDVAYKFGEKIIADTARTQALADIAQATPICRQLKEFMFSLRGKNK